MRCFSDDRANNSYYISVTFTSHHNDGKVSQLKENDMIILLDKLLLCGVR